MTTAAVNNKKPSAPRERLLEAAMQYVASNGVADVSLRELAAAIGTSHRMLIYHFGSKEGLMTAIVQTVEEAQRQFFAEFTADPTVTPLEAARAFWKRVADPSLAPNVRLFFELYAQALQGRPGTAGFLDDIVDSWVRPIADYEIQHGVAESLAQADARLGVAVTRGLLLDLVATGERDAVDAAFERYVSLSAQASPGISEPSGGSAGPGSAPTRRGRRESRDAAAASAGVSARRR